MKGVLANVDFQGMGELQIEESSQARCNGKGRNEIQVRKKQDLTASCAFHMFHIFLILNLQNPILAHQPLPKSASNSNSSRCSRRGHVPKETPGSPRRSRGLVVEKKERVSSLIASLLLEKLRESFGAVWLGTARMHEIPCSTEKRMSTLDKLFLSNSIRPLA